MLRNVEFADAIRNDEVYLNEHKAMNDKKIDRIWQATMREEREL